MHLNTISDLEHADSILDFFHGQKVTEIDVPTYVFVKDYQDACSTYDVAYRIFYPYNYGKDVCIGTMVGGECHGYLQSFGNHVGDWEHFGIRIRYGKVEACYIAVHNIGAWYTWNEDTGNFLFDKVSRKFWQEIAFFYQENNRSSPGGSKGEDEGIFPVKYPETVELVDGHHAELFSANGSHGMWSANGTHEYLNILFVHLKDETDRGYALQTWNNLEIVNYDPDEEYIEDLHYLGFRGRWGNLEQGCEIVKPITGECILVGGPGFWRQGPSDFPDDCPVAQ